MRTATPEIHLRDMHNPIRLTTPSVTMRVYSDAVRFVSEDGRSAAPGLESVNTHEVLNARGYRFFGGNGTWTKDFQISAVDTVFTKIADEIRGLREIGFEIVVNPDPQFAMPPYNQDRALAAAK